MPSFDGIIRDTWPTATERSDFVRHAATQAWSDPLVQDRNRQDIAELESFANDPANHEGQEG